jgi:hypothetical protein
MAGAATMTPATPAVTRKVGSTDVYRCPLRVLLAAVVAKFAFLALGVAISTVIAVGTWVTVIRPPTNPYDD